MNHRERILAAIRHAPCDRLPTDMWYTPEVQRRLLDHFHVEKMVEVYDLLDVDGLIGIAPPYIGPAPRKEEGYWENEWGMGYRVQAYETGEYTEMVRHPLAEAETVADLQRYRWPSPDDYDYSALPDMAAQYPDRAVACGYTAVFYYHNLLRGLEASLMDPLLRPEFTRYLVERISDFFTEYHRRCFEATRGLVVSTQVTDDWGSQHGLLTSLRIFEEFYRVPTQRAIDLAHQHGLFVFHHDDGDMRPILPALREMGIDILNPIQYRCGDWDLNWLKATYGDRFCFHGGVDNQGVLPFGSAEDVRAEVRKLKATLGKDGTGLIIASCHNIQPVTPLENILALYDEARKQDGE